MPMSRLNRIRLANRQRIKAGRKVRARYRTKILRSMSSKRMLNVHHFKEVVSKGYIGGASSGTSPNLYISGALTFRLDDCANVADLSAVFDQIRLNKVLVEFIPLINVMSGTNINGAGNINYGPLTNGTTYLGQFYTCIDHDDKTAPTSKTAIQQYATCRSVPIYKGMKRLVVPAYQRTIQQTPSVQTTSAAYKQWFDIATPSVEHYGIKYLVDMGTSSQTNAQVYEIKCTYYYSCKEQR